MKIEELGLSVRPYNVLKRARIDTVEQLQQLSDEDLMRFRNMGRHSLEEIREKVAYVKTMTRADKLRTMSDEYMCSFIYDLTGSGIYCTNKKECLEKIDTDEITDEMCKKCLLEYLQKPAEEQPHRIFEDKQESGLLED